MERILTYPGRIAEEASHYLLNLGVTDVGFTVAGAEGSSTIGGGVARVPREDRNRVLAFPVRIRSEFGNDR